jgi:hypothetical protein
MTFGRYVLGVALLVAVVASVAFGSVRLRRRLLPLWTGALARLAETTISLGIVLGVAELLGIVGLLRCGFVVAGCVIAGVALGVTQWPSVQPSEHRPLAPPVSRLGIAIALVVSVVVLAHWGAGAREAFSGGMTGPDTLGYHGPIAATFVQRASIVHPFYVYTDPAVAFFPATSELVHSVGILLFSRDVMSPLINLAWLGLTLLAGWCIGRPRGLGPASLLLTAVVVDAPVLSSTQPGSADNDIVALALLMASIALLFNAYPAAVPGGGEATGGDARPRGGDRGTGAPVAAVALAGLAGGLAIGVKVTMLAPIGLLALAVLVAASGGLRARLAWIGALLAVSAVWFVRNLVAFGNPVPAVHLGIFPSPRIPLGTTVADDFTNVSVWRHFFLPGLHSAFTFAWPVILALALVGIVIAAVRGPTRLDRMLALAATLATLAYVLTPRTALGPGAFLFTVNLRYAVPAIVIGSALLFRLPHSGWVLRQPLVLAVLAAGVAVDLLNRGQGPLVGAFATLGATPHLLGTPGMWAAIAVAAAVAFLVYRRPAAPRVPMAAWLVIVAAVGLLAWPAESSYLRSRYTTGPLAFARSLHHQRMAIDGFLQPYPAYGLDLSNPVVEISHHGPHGAQTPIRSCQDWRRALAAGRYDYVITSAPYRLLYRDAPEGTQWTRSDPSATELSATPDGIGGTISIFRLRGRPQPGLCP